MATTDRQATLSGEGSGSPTTSTISGARGKNFVEATLGWTGFGAVGFFGVGLLVSGNLPPLSPNLTAEQTKSQLLEHALGYKFAGVFMLLALMCFMTLYAGIAMQIKRMGGPNAQRLSTVQVLLGGLSLVPLYLTALLFALSVYRPERSAEAIQSLSDLAWFALVMPVTPALAQMFAIGFATLGDTRANPIYPRWYGYGTFWVGGLLMAGLTVPFFLTGPLAWNGAFAFWMPAFVLCNFCVATSVLMIKASKNP